jgi:N-acetylglucosamine kinase-like BadF-type ATPase
VLAIDGGNSKTDAIAVAADGVVLTSRRGGGFRPQTDGLAAALAVLDRLIEEVAADLGGGPRPFATQVSAYLAGADLPVEEDALQQAVAARGWGESTRTGNDTFAILRAGSSAGWGVAVVCGAGINCVGVAPDGRTARFPSVGRTSGDWGGGAFLGEEALWYAARGEDGRGAPTALSRTVPAHFGMGSVLELIEALHLDRLSHERLNELTPVLFTAAAAGDEVAGAVVDRLADEVCALASVTLRRLDLLGTPTEVVLGGGVLAARDARLTAGVRERLAAAAPLARPIIVTTPPVLGAALLGLDALGGPSAAERRLRAAFADLDTPDAVETV